MTAEQSHEEVLSLTEAREKLFDIGVGKTVWENGWPVHITDEERSEFKATGGIE